MRLISDTEIRVKNTCGTLHGFIYNHSLEPRVYPVHLERGAIAHKVLEAYYNCKKDNYSFESSKAEAMLVFELEVKKLINKVSGDTSYIEMIVHLKDLLHLYFDYYKDESYKILEVEEFHKAHLVDDVHFGMYLDILAEETKGPLRGDIVVIDTKLVFNFKSHDELILDGQIPKYIKALRLDGVPVKRGVYNQIRHRKMKTPSLDDLFKRTSTVPSKAKLDNIWEEQKGAAVEEVPNRRIMNPIVCKNCFFLQPCSAELDGQPIDRILEVNYQPRNSPFKSWSLEVNSNR